MNRFITWNIIALLRDLIRLAEAEFGSGTGAEKKAAVIAGSKQFAVDIIAGGAGAVAANNPQYADAIGGLIDTLVPVVIPKQTVAVPDAQIAA